MAGESQPSGLGLLSPGVKRTRDTAEMDTHAREVGRSTVASCWRRRRAPRRPPRCPRAPPAEFAEGDSDDRSAGNKIAASAVTTDTARRILQTLDRLAGQKSGDGALASPMAKPTNLSSSLNKAAAPSSSLHGFRGIQRATPAKSLASAEKRVSAPIASHSKPKPAPATRVAAPSALQFEPEAFKEIKPSPAAPSPPAGFGNAASAAAAKPVPPPAPLFSASPRRPAPPTRLARRRTGPCSPSGTPTRFPPPLPQNVARRRARPSEQSLRRQDGEDEPTFTFGGNDDGVIDSGGFTGCPGRGHQADADTTGFVAATSVTIECQSNIQANDAKGGAVAFDIVTTADTVRSQRRR